MAIRFEHVTCRREGADLRRSIALDALDAELQPGRFIAVLGAPGSGKSTLLQHLNGLLLPDEGAVQVFEHRLEAPKPPTPGAGSGWFDRRRRRMNQPAANFAVLRRKVGLVFQFPEQQLFEETVLRDLMFGPLNFGLGEAEAEAAARSAARALGLNEALLDRSPFELSGGQMRKAAIAAVLAAEPDVLALDEPASSLDQASREELMRLLHGWRRERGKTIILVTHRLDEVLPYADEYVVLDAGKCLFQGGAAELLRDPALMAKAGIAAPPSERLLAGAAERAGGLATPPAPYLEPDAAADWIRQLLPAGRRGEA